MLGASTFGAKSTSTKETAPPWHSAAAAAAVASKNAGVWGSTLPVTPVGDRSPAGSFSSNRRLSNASTNSAHSVANAARMSNRVAGGASSLHGTLSNGRLSKEATATAIQLIHNQSSAESRRKLKKARAVMSAYENHTRAANAANEAHFRRLNELYGPRGGQGATATSATGSANAAASWAVPNAAAGMLRPGKAKPVAPLPVTSRIFGAASPLPAAAEASSALYGTRVNAPAAAATAAVRASGVLAPPLLNKNRKRSSRRRSSRSQRQQTRRSH